jgi:hypothetical protein
MDIIWFYLFACIPFLVGGMLWALGKEVHWGEWLGGTAASFALAGIMHAVASLGATADVETWSGHIVKAVHYPRWIEEYVQVHVRTRTDANGNVHTETYTTIEHRTHPEHWTAYSNISSEYEIDRAKYEEMVAVFGNRSTERPHKSGFDGGDPNVYATYNKSAGEYYPITSRRMWENKVRATPSTFSFPKVPKAVMVFDYPGNSDPWRSDRLLGSASLLDIREFDRLNARLGPRKKVNLIMVGFGGRDSMAAQWQEAAWVGGKKNDVVICWGGSNKKPTWARAFGWTDRKIVLRNLESLILEIGAVPDVLPLVEEEIIKNYQLKDWEKSFAHIRVPAPMWAAWTYFSMAVVAQALFWWWAHHNDLGKDGPRYRRWRY